MAAVIMDPRGRHLLVEESPDGRNVYNQPAGHLEQGESLIEAVVREVREETCRAFTPRALLGVYRWQVSPDGDTYLRFCFLGEAGEELPGVRRDPDILGPRWATSADLEGGLTPRSPLVRRCMRDAEAGRAFPLELLRDLGNTHVR